MVVLTFFDPLVLNKYPIQSFSSCKPHFENHLKDIIFAQKHMRV